MGVREKGNADYEKGYRKGYQNGHRAGAKARKIRVNDFANLVEVVRCKKYIDNRVNVDGTPENWCYHFGCEVEPNGFCDHGEAVE